MAANGADDVQTNGTASEQEEPLGLDGRFDINSAIGHLICYSFFPLTITTPVNEETLDRRLEVPGTSTNTNAILKNTINTFHEIIQDKDNEIARLKTMVAAADLPEVKFASEQSQTVIQGGQMDLWQERFDSLEKENVDLKTESTIYQRYEASEKQRLMVDAKLRQSEINKEMCDKQLRELDEAKSSHLKKLAEIEKQLDQLAAGNAEVDGKLTPIITSLKNQEREYQAGQLTFGSDVNNKIGGDEKAANDENTVEKADEKMQAVLVERNEALKKLTNQTKEVEKLQQITAELKTQIEGLKALQGDIKDQQGEEADKNKQVEENVHVDSSTTAATIANIADSNGVEEGLSLVNTCAIVTVLSKDDTDEAKPLDIFLVFFECKALVSLIKNVSTPEYTTHEDMASAQKFCEKLLLTIERSVHALGWALHTDVYQDLDPEHFITTIGKNIEAFDLDESMEVFAAHYYLPSMETADSLPKKIEHVDRADSETQIDTELTPAEQVKTADKETQIDNELEVEEAEKGQQFQKLGSSTTDASFAALQGLVEVANKETQFCNELTNFQTQSTITDDIAFSMPQQQVETAEKETDIFSNLTHLEDATTNTDSPPATKNKVTTRPTTDRWKSLSKPTLSTSMKKVPKGVYVQTEPVIFRDDMPRRKSSVPLAKGLMTRHRTVSSQTSDPMLPNPMNMDTNHSVSGISSTSKTISLKTRGETSSKPPALQSPATRLHQQRTHPNLHHDAPIDTHKVVAKPLTSFLSTKHTEISSLEGFHQRVTSGIEFRLNSAFIEIRPQDGSSRSTAENR